MAEMVDRKEFELFRCEYGDKSDIHSDEPETITETGHTLY